MVTPATLPGYIEITETLLRLYVFLAQYLDRCLDESLRKSFPEDDLQRHLAATRGRIMEILSVNRVVKTKIGEECERILSIGDACLKAGAAFGPAAASVQRAQHDQDEQIEALKMERTILKSKTIALSDLLAVFRAL
jgi:hypothetical protein